MKLIKAGNTKEWQGPIERYFAAWQLGWWRARPAWPGWAYHSIRVTDHFSLIRPRKYSCSCSICDAGETVRWTTTTEMKIFLGAKSSLRRRRWRRGSLRKPGQGLSSFLAYSPLQSAPYIAMSVCVGLTAPEYLGSTLYRRWQSVPHLFFLWILREISTWRVGIFKYHFWC